jgi:hypothetical protein
MRSKLKILAFTLIPCLIFFGLLEVGIRIWGGLSPSIFSLPLPEEKAGLFRFDPELFWSMKPEADVNYKGSRVVTNELGLRGPFVPVKKNNEFRILSLGESSTFGARVEYEQTYSALLEKLLNRSFPRGPYFRVINAGVSAYSSFQSYRYLLNRGLKLKPDLVLFYHEFNDYLPSSLRDSTHCELGVPLSDMELHRMRRRSVSGRLIRYSALYRALRLLTARRAIMRFGEAETSNPLLKIGLPDTGLAPRLRMNRRGKRTRLDLDEKRLPTRVSRTERGIILEKLAALCRENRVQLLLIHPSYRKSQAHQCILTEFAKQSQLPLFEAFPVLHPPGKDVSDYFVDSWHPTPLGHRALAESLFEFLRKKMDLPS